MDAQIKQIDMRMDKLVGTFLEGLIEKEIYLKKKDELLKEKSDLKFKNSDFGQKGKSWVEPLRDWVKIAHFTGKLADSDSDYKDLSSALQKVGSNPILKIKKLYLNGCRLLIFSPNTGS